VTILMDSDSAGRAAATRIADGLRQVADAHIVDVAPGQRDGYDLTDWLLEHASLAREDLHAQLVGRPHSKRTTGGTSPMTLPLEMNGLPARAHHAVAVRIARSSGGR
jgi:hypothetical protein